MEQKKPLDDKAEDKEPNIKTRRSFAGSKLFRESCQSASFASQLTIR
jgi:hypothetical protein